MSKPKVTGKEKSQNKGNAPREKELSGLFSDKEKSQDQRNGRRLLLKELQELEKSQIAVGDNDHLLTRAKINELQSEQNNDNPPPDSDQEDNAAEAGSVDELDDISDYQNLLIDFINNGFAQGVMQMLDADKRAINLKDGVKRGDDISSSLISIQNKKSALEMKDAIEKIYDKFAAMGFEVDKKQAEGKSGEISYFFGINFPPNYQGNKSPITMDAKQIEQALQCLHEAKEQGLQGVNPSSESIGINSGLEQFHAEHQQQFLKDILARGSKSKDSVVNDIVNRARNNSSVRGG